MVYAEFGGQTECIMGNSKIENTTHSYQLNSDPVPRKGKNQYGGWDARLVVYRFLIECILVLSNISEL